MKFLLITIGCFLVVKQTWGHGMMIDPPGRSSVWRFKSSAPTNYDDNALNCGGFWTQWGENNGNCGVCGDSFADPHPQNNENTGTYGKGIVVSKYEAGSVIKTTVMLTSNHLGDFTFSICNLQDHSAPETEECFVPLTLAGGFSRYNVSSTDYSVTNEVQLPTDLKCERCVLRWHYTAGNNWGVCEDGTQADGCGPQENFRSCADITIV